MNLQEQIEISFHKLAGARKDRGLNLSDVMDASVASKLETGKMKITSDYLQTYADKLGYAVELKLIKLL